MGRTMKETIKLTAEMTIDQAAKLGERCGEAVQIAKVEYDPKTGKATVRLTVSDGTMLVRSTNG